MDPMRVLIVEDDEGIVEIVQLGLGYQGAEVAVARDGIEALRLFHEWKPNVVLLDIMLPRLDGITVLRRIRAAGDTPVILLTARGGLGDRVSGLEAGADDYVTKPFQLPELVARMRAVLRRRGSLGEPSTLQVADLRVDRRASRVTRSDDVIELTAKQFELLDLLVTHAGQVLSKEQIYEGVWGWDYLDNANLVEQHVSHLRQRVDEGREPKLIHTVRGAGYVLRDGQ
ncbi:MAG: response regulator transcription factor [Acidimicrobiia bacterium]